MNKQQIEWYVFNQLNGLKRLSSTQVKEFTEIVLNDLNLLNTPENCNTIHKAIENYFAHI